MSSGTEQPRKGAHQAELTFKNYDALQAQKYADYRPAYDSRLLDLIIKTHISTGGETVRVLDVGSGPGIATRQIAGYFENAIGVDASEGMIEKAKNTPCYSSTGAQASFHVCNAEDIDKVLEPNSIDLITVATAAHWFDMPKFYVAASKILKPGGTIAIWGGASWYPDPETTPNATDIQRVWTELEWEILRPYEMPGNRLARELLVDLDLPWTVNTSSSTSEVKAALETFDQHNFTRREFNKDGKPDSDPMLADTNGYLNHKRVPLKLAAKIIGTASPVTRWREANKEALEKGEIEDCVDKMIRLTREEMAKDPEFVDRDWADSITAMVLLMIKKKA